MSIHDQTLPYAGAWASVDTALDHGSLPSTAIRRVERHDRRRRAQKACSHCNARKVRCDIGEGAGPCQNCRNANTACIPHERRRSRRANYPLSHHASYTEHRLLPEPFATPEEQRPRESILEERNRLNTNTKSTQDFASLIDKDILNIGHTRPRSSEGLTATHFTAKSEVYLGGLVYSNNQSGNYIASSQEPLPKPFQDNIDIPLLRPRAVLELPPRAIRQSLISSFKTYCSPWMPIVEASELEKLGENNLKLDENGGPSLLLAQALFVAGSRVQSSSQTFLSCNDFYNRARALFFAEHERNSLKVIISACLLQWYNPTGPEYTSIHSSNFWLKTAISLGFQVGLHREPDVEREDGKLRRRLFWTLFARDSLLCAAQGRPRAIQLDDCNVRRLTLGDFALPDKNARMFLAYVDICETLGRLAENSLRGVNHAASQTQIGERLRLWISQLPPDLRLDGAAYDFDVRQLHLPYLTALSILHNPIPSIDCSAAAILASSCVARFFEDYSARDVIRHLGPISSFYLLVAGLPQISCLRYPALSDLASSELKIIRYSLQEIGKTWQGAHGALHRLNQYHRLVTAGSIEQSTRRLNVTQNQLAYFSKPHQELCPKWHLIVPYDKSTPQRTPLGSGQETRIPLSTEQQDSAMRTESASTLSVALDSVWTSSAQPEYALTSVHTESTAVDWMSAGMEDQYNTQDCFNSGANWMLKGWEADFQRN